MGALHQKMMCPNETEWRVQLGTSMGGQLGSGTDPSWGAQSESVKATTHLPCRAGAAPWGGGNLAKASRGVVSCKPPVANHVMT